MNKTNMLILSNYLMSNADRLAQHFDMKRFLKHNGRKYYNKSGPTLEELNIAMNQPHVCDTSACAVGFAPAVIPVVLSDFTESNQLNYLRYSERVFMDSEKEEWNYCFSGAWDEIDNTIKGAAFRLWLVANNSDVYGNINAATDEMLNNLLEIEDSSNTHCCLLIEEYETLRDNWIANFTPAKVN